MLVLAYNDLIIVSIFSSDNTLNEMVVLDPVWLIDVLKCLITDDKNVLKCPSIIEEWKRFSLTGIIKRSVIGT